MIDDQQAQTYPEGANQEAPMPSAEQQPDESLTEQPGASDSTQDVSDSTLPEGVKERTSHEFEKLREQLRTERERRQYAESVFTSLQPKAPAPVATPIYDPETGLLNESVLTDVQQRAIAAEDRARRAEAAVQTYMEDQEKKEAYASYPELEPGPKLDKQLHVTTRSILLDSMVNPDDYGGKQLTFKQAADYARKISAPLVAQAKKQGAQEAIEQLTPKEQAALEATGSPGRRSEVSSNMTDLQSQTRRGSESATIERLKGIPWK